MWRPVPKFERKEQPVVLDFNTVRDYYQKNPDSCFDRIAYLLSFGLVKNENMGRFSFEEDACPKGLMNVHIIHTDGGDNESTNHNHSSERVAKLNGDIRFRQHR